MVFWPFSKAFGAGLTHGQVPTHTDLNKLDNQVAQAADGALWTDVAGAANFVYSFDGGGADLVGAAAWRDISGEWFVAGISATNPTVKKAWPPFVLNDSFDAQTVPAGSGFTGQIALCCNPAGVLLLGGTPNAGTTAKLRRSPDGTTWTTLDTPTALGIKAIDWFPAVGKFLVGYGSGTVVDTSVDGVAWASRTSPNSEERGLMAASPSRLVWAASRFVTTSKVITTDDAITFTERDVGSSEQWGGITYSPTLQKWFIVSAGGSVRSSSDGVTWTAGTSFATTLVVALASYGRALFAVGNGSSGNAEVWCSIDGATTWRRIARWKFSIPTTVSHMVVGPGGQLMVIDRLAGQARASLRLGA